MTTNSARSRQFGRLTPEGQLRGLVRADEIKQFRRRQFVSILAHGIDGIGNAAAPDFPVVHFAGRIARQSQAQQAQPFAGGRGMRRRLKRRLRGRNEKDAGQASSSRAAWATSKWPQMHRIKRTAKKSNLHVSNILSSND